MEPSSLPTRLPLWAQEGAKIYAQNAIRKKSEQLNYMKLASRLDAVVSRLETQAKMQMVGKNMSGIVKSLEKTMESNNLEKIMETMNMFEKQFEVRGRKLLFLEVCCSMPGILLLSSSSSSLTTQEVVMQTKPTLCAFAPLDPAPLLPCLTPLLFCAHSLSQNLDLQTQVMDNVMGAQANLSTPEDEVTSLMQQVADEHGLEMQMNMPSASGAAVPAQKVAQESDPLAQRLAELKAK
jgi:division protein CdvB (Snf7/Vps24/ESCRT-III family)